jgi:hypothetical protein
LILFQRSFLVTLGVVRMTASDRRLVALGALPAAVYASIIAIGTAAGVEWPGGAPMVLGLGVVIATAFPALANFLRVRRNGNRTL